MFNLEGTGLRYSRMGESIGPETSGEYGGVAQLGEHLPCKQGVRGSNPLISTKGSKNWTA